MFISIQVAKLWMGYDSALVHFQLKLTSLLTGNAVQGSSKGERFTMRDISSSGTDDFIVGRTVTLAALDI